MIKKPNQDHNGLEAKSIFKSYGEKQVLRDVSISVKRGEAVGLLGPNGAGKTTCFTIIAGLIKPSAGTITLDSQNITHWPMYQRARMGIGYLPQESSIFRTMTVEDNVLSVLELFEPDSHKRATLLQSLLDEFGISHLRKSIAMTLSGGERRRTELARALAADPHFILLDEPLAGIDPIAVGDVRNLVAHLKDRGIGVLLTDHNVREALDVIDHAYILHDGQVLMHGTPAEIISNKKVRRVYLGESFSM